MTDDMTDDIAPYAPMPVVDGPNPHFVCGPCPECGFDHCTQAPGGPDEVGA